MIFSPLLAIWFGITVLALSCTFPISTAFQKPVGILGNAMGYLGGRLAEANHFQSISGSTYNGALFSVFYFRAMARAFDQRPALYFLRGECNRINADLFWHSSPSHSWGTEDSSQERFLASYLHLDSRLGSGTSGDERRSPAGGWLFCENGEILNESSKDLRLS